MTLSIIYWYSFNLENKKNPGEALNAHTLKSWWNNFQVNKRYEKNFYSRRRATINIHSGNYDQKIEIHEIAKAKLSGTFSMLSPRST